MITEIQMTMLPKILAIAGGSGWSLLAQAAGPTIENQAVHVYGGWGVAVIGLFTLWKDNKEIRHSAEVERKELARQMEEASKRADGKHREHLKYVQECTEELRTLRKLQEVRCAAIQNKKGK